MSLGRDFSPSFAMPSAIAPLDTITTPRSGIAFRSATVSAASLDHASPSRLFDPILRTIRRAAAKRARTVVSSIEERSPADSDIAEPGRLVGDLVERGEEPSLHVARQRRAREQERVGDARELVPEILDLALGH